MKYLPVFVLFLILFTGCRQNTSKTSDFAGLEQAPSSPETMDREESTSSGFQPSSGQLEVKPEVQQKKIIKDGRLGIKVTELEETKARIDTLVASYQGYYSNENLSNTDYESAYTLQIRIPSSNFEKLIAAIESGEGEIMYKNLVARDVTEEFIDLETRLENKRSYLKRYNDLLKQAKSVNEILEIEGKTRVIEEEIESAEGRLKYLNDQVSYSTLDLTITKEEGFKYRPHSKNDFWERMKYSLSGGWSGFIDFLLFIIRIWPFWIILGLALLLWKRIRARRKKRLA